MITIIKRLLTTLALALTIVVGSGIPASATYSDTAPLHEITVGTRTVLAPFNVTGKLTCGPSTSTMNVTWGQSTTPRISGYRVTVHFSDGYEQSETIAATATSWTKPITTYNVTAFAVRYSVTTLTDYGWFTQSGLTGSFRC